MNKKFRTKSIDFPYKLNKNADDHPRIPFIRSFGLIQTEEVQTKYKTLRPRPHLYGCAINPFIPEGEDQIAVAVGLRAVFLYELPTQKPEVNLLSHMTLDVPEDKETLHTVTWCLDHKDQGGKHKIVCGGADGVLFVINASTLEVDRELLGHNNEINDVRTCPTNPALVVTASKDRTVRVFHIREETCLLLFGSRLGHTDSVVTADWAFDAKSIISGGFDHKLVVWDLETRTVAEHMEKCMVKIDAGLPVESFVVDLESIDRLSSGMTTFDPNGHSLLINRPTDIIKDIHFEAVDCIRSIKLNGQNYILSKATGRERSITLWRTGLMDPNSVQHPDAGINKSYVEIWTKEIKHWQCYFSKFAIDPLRKWVVATTSSGTLNFYKLFDKDSEEPFVVHDVSPTKDQAHDVSFSTDGQILLCVGAKGLLVRLDRVPDTYTKDPVDLW